MSSLSSLEWHSQWCPHWMTWGSKVFSLFVPWRPQLLLHRSVRHNFPAVLLTVGLHNPTRASQVSISACDFYQCSSVSKRVCLQCRRPGFSSWVGKIPWRRKWQSTPVFCPGECHGQRSLAGYSLRGHKSQTRLSTQHTYTQHINAEWDTLDSRNLFSIKCQGSQEPPPLSVDCFILCVTAQLLGSLVPLPGIEPEPTAVKSGES